MMKFLMFAASLRKESCNKKLIAVAASIAKKQNIEVDLVDFAEFIAPAYNADVQNSTGFPKEVTHFVSKLKEAHALVIASPEYNYSIPGTLKNLIDWVSRLDPVPWKSSQILLLSASPSLVGGNRGLWCTRMPLEACGGFVFPDMFSLASAYTAFDEKGQLKEQALFDRLTQTVSSFTAYVSKLVK